MPIYQTQTTSFKAELPQGIHNLLTDAIKLALYTDAATLDEAVTTYSTAHEVSGSGYIAGGVILTNPSINVSGTTAYVSFDNAVWSPANFVAAGGLIYNSSKANRTIAVISFGGNKVATNTFTVQMPPNTASSALLRFK